MKEEFMDFFNWVVDEFTTDEGRLPLSGNTELGGRTIFINGEEYPIGHIYDLYIQRGNKPPKQSIQDLTQNQPKSNYVIKNKR